MVKFQILNFPRFKFLKINKIWGRVLICCSCYNKGPQATWLKQQKCTISEFYPKEIIRDVHNELCIRMFIAALFMVAKPWDKTQHTVLKE